MYVKLIDKVLEISKIRGKKVIKINTTDKELQTVLISKLGFVLINNMYEKDL